MWDKHNILIFLPRNFIGTVSTKNWLFYLFTIFNKVCVCSFGEVNTCFFNVWKYNLPFSNLYFILNVFRYDFIHINLSLSQYCKFLHLTNTLYWNPQKCNHILFTEYQYFISSYIIYSPIDREASKTWMPLKSFILI